MLATAGSTAAAGRCGLRTGAAAGGLEAAQLQQPPQQGAAAYPARTPAGGSDLAWLAYKVGAGTELPMFRISHAAVSIKGSNSREQQPEGAQPLYK